MKFFSLILKAQISFLSIRTISSYSLLSKYSSTLPLNLRNFSMSKKGGPLDPTNDFKLYPNSFIIGVDEAGRGPLSGPVVAAACLIPKDSPIIDNIRDSKLMNEEERDLAYEQIHTIPGLRYCVCSVDAPEIDELNILNASLTAMTRATRGLLEGLSIELSPLNDEEKFLEITNNNYPYSGIDPLPKDANSFFPLAPIKSEETKDLDKFIGFIDGPKQPKYFPIQSVPIIHGDRFHYSIAVASIIAKVRRDEIMKKIDLDFPEYDWKNNKGYPTQAHRDLCNQYGVTHYHRFSYNPVKLAYKSKGLNKNEKDFVPIIPLSSKEKLELQKLNSKSVIPDKKLYSDKKISIKNKQEDKEDNNNPKKKIKVEKLEKEIKNKNENIKNENEMNNESIAYRTRSRKSL